MNEYLKITEEVKDALATNKPVVALESTIISHGMPYPKNVETAKRVEATIRKEGAVPATIAIIGGKLNVGLSADELEYFGKKGTAITKASRRDIPYLCARKEDGATTVAGGGGGGRRWPSRTSPASRCSPPEGSEGCTEAWRKRWTSPPILRNCPAPR